MDNMNLEPEEMTSGKGKKKKVQKSEDSNKGLMAMLVGIVILLMGDVYIIINMPQNYIAIVAVTILLAGCLYLFVNSLINEIKSENTKNKALADEQYDAIFKSEKASYLLLKRTIDQLDVLEEGQRKPTEEILNAQKALSKLTINKNSENTQSLQSANDRMLDKLRDLESAINDSQKNLMDIQRGNMDSSIKELVSNQQEITVNIRTMENSLRNDLAAMMNNIQSIQSNQQAQELKIESMKQALETRPQTTYVERVPVQMAAPEPVAQPVPEPVPEVSAVAEEPIVEEPVIEEPAPEAVAQEPLVEEPPVEEPVAEETPVEEAVAEEPAVDMTIGDLLEAGSDETIGDLLEAEGPIETDLGTEPEEAKEESGLDEGLGDLDLGLDLGLDLDSLDMGPGGDAEVPEEAVSELGLDDSLDLGAELAEEAPAEEAAEPAPEPAPAAEEKPAMPDLSDPNKLMSPDEIAALIANM